MSERKLLAADLADNWMDLADLVFARNDLDSVLRYMGRARELISRKPHKSHKFDLINEWREVVRRYNSLVEVYESRGIKLERIII